MVKLGCMGNECSIDLLKSQTENLAFFFSVIILQHQINGIIFDKIMKIYLIC